MADEDVKIVIKQKGTIPVYTKTKVGVAEVHHDETLKGRGTTSAPLGISDEVMEEIGNAGKVDDVRVDGVSVVTNKIAEIDLTGKVDKTSESDKVYGTDAQGNQTTYDVDGFGKVDDVLVNGTSVVTNKIAEVEVPTAVSQLTNDADYQNGTQVSNTVSGAITTHNTSNNAHSNLLTPITQDIDAIEEKIPAEASSSNQLADKAYVDSQIGDIDEWTTEQYTPTTTNFVVGQTYTVEEAFQRTASLFAGQQGEIDDIEAVIPAQATTQNQLADKNFVNATVATNSANFRGNWATWAVVPTDANLYPEDYVGNRTPTNNDYMVVDDASGYQGDYDNLMSITIRNTGDDAAYPGFSYTFVENGSIIKAVAYPSRSSVEVSAVVKEGMYITLNRGGYLQCRVNFYSDAEHTQPLQVKYNNNLVSSITSTISTSITEQFYYASLEPLEGSWRFIYVGDWNTTGKEGWRPVYQIGTAFTQEQQAAIDSGITANMVDNYVDPNSTAATAYNARITAVETDKRDIINSASKVYATDANGANKNDLVYATAATADTIAQRGTNGVLKVGTPTDNADATTKLYVDTIASAKQDTLTAGQNITITNNVISAAGAVYNAGEGILINSNNDIMTNNIIWRYW